MGVVLKPMYFCLLPEWHLLKGRNLEDPSFWTIIIYIYIHIIHILSSLISLGKSLVFGWSGDLRHLVSRHVASPKQHGWWGCRSCIPSWRFHVESPRWGYPRYNWVIQCYTYIIYCIYIYTYIYIYTNIYIYIHILNGNMHRRLVGFLQNRPRIQHSPVF